MQRVSSKNDLIHLVLQWAHRNGMPRLATAREDGAVEFLGGFRDLDKGDPGWVLTFADIYFDIYDIIAVVARGGRLYVRWLSELDWSKWDGDRSENPLYQGDNPDHYKQLKRDKEIWPKNT